MMRIGFLMANKCVYSIYSDVFVNIWKIQILIISTKMHSLEISYLQKIKIEI